MLCENTRKSLNQQIWVWHISKIAIFRLFKYRGRVGKGIVKFCHPLHVANFSLLLVQNSLLYVNTMTFESILSICLFKTGMFQRIKKIFFFFLLNLKYGAQRSHSETCSLKKCTLPYIYFVIKCLVLYFGIKKEGLEKKFEYFFIGSEHP